MEGRVCVCVCVFGPPSRIGCHTDVWLLSSFMRQLGPSSGGLGVGFETNKGRMDGYVF